MFDRNEIMMVISDLSKEAYGFRSRKNFAAMTDEDLKAEYDYLFTIAENNWKEEKEYRILKMAEHESHLNTMMQRYNISRETAIRWDMQAENEEDYEHYLWLKGVL